MIKRNDDPEPISLKELKSNILKMMDEGECTITEADGKTVYKIKPTKVGQRKGKSDKISQINSELVHGVILDRIKRIYRREEDLPEPGLGTQAEENRLTKQFQARISQDHVALFEAVRGNFPNKRAAMERAVELLAQDQGVDL